MTAPQVRVLVTAPDTYQFVADVPLDVANVLYPHELGYELRLVRGHDGPYGFVHDGQVTR